MFRTLSLPALALVALGFATSSATAQRPVKSDEPARLVVYVPSAAQITIDGHKTTSTGDVRRFTSPPLSKGKGFTYKVKAIWKEDGQEVVREQDARVEAGKETVLDLRQEEKKDTKPAKKEEEKDTEPQFQEEPVVGDVVYWPTPQAVVNKMLEVAEVKKGDVVYDLGCGDGRIVVTAAKKYGAKGFGFDINPKRVKESLANVKKNKVEDLVTIKERDIFRPPLDLKDASVVTLYLLPDLNVRLMPQLEKLKPGSRIVSHDFDMKGAKPKKTITIKAKDHRGELEHTIYLWVVPWEKE